MIMYTDMLCDRVRGTPPPLVATVSTCVSLGMHVEPEGHAPLYGICDRKYLCACVTRCWARLECLVRSGDCTWNSKDSRACADSPSDARESRRGVTWVSSDQNMFRTGLELRITSIMENDNSYKDNYYT